MGQNTTQKVSLFSFFPFCSFVRSRAKSIFIQFIPELIIEQTHLVNIPKINVRELESILKYPDFSQITNYKVWTVAYTVAIIASLETLLNLEAVDNIDPQKDIRHRIGN